jgi:CheY-like chemotaxis protein
MGLKPKRGITPPLRILTVEDEAFEAVALKDALKALGHDVVGHAYTGGGAILLAEEFTPDLIIMDVALAGGIDGIRAAEEIHARSDIPIIFTSGRRDRDVRMRVLEVGFLGFLEKPYSAEDLDAVLAEAATRLRVRSPYRFRRKRGQEVWHFCENCTTWPAADYDEQNSVRRYHELCNECCVKSQLATCDRVP